MPKTRNPLTVSGLLFWCSNLEIGPFSATLSGMPTSLILIIDDELELAESLAMVLEMKDYRVTVKPTAEEGLAELAAEEPGLVVMDGSLPGIDGDEAIRQIRESGSALPILAVRAEEERRETMFAAGANAFLAKPLEMPEFLAEVGRLLG